MMLAHLRGLLKPVGKVTGDRQREELVLEALDMEEKAFSIRTNSLLLATVLAPAKITMDSRKKLNEELMERLARARLLATLDLPEFIRASSSLAPELVYAAVAATGLLNKKPHVDQ